jgi:osmotically-inducible protein OsmY
MTQILNLKDHELKAAILDELEWAADVDSDHVAVSVTDGAVALSGEVATYSQRRHAVRAVQRVHGVTAVADELVVRRAHGSREDVDISREVATALVVSGFRAADSVKAEVRDRMVTLTGSVVWHYQRTAAEHAVGSVAGVTGVVNAIALIPRPTLAPADAMSRIDSALTRSAEIDARHLHIDVTGAVVTLTGTVTSWAQVRQAAHAAWSTPGVTHVQNELRVTA